MYTLESARLYDWAGYCGVPGGIPDRTTIYSTLTSSSTLSQINAAIAACPSGQVVSLAAGTYNLAGNMNPKSGVTVRGAGPGQTIIVNSANHCFYYDGYGFAESNARGISSGYTKGSMSIVLSSAPSSLFVAGRLMAITEDASPNKFATGIGVYARDGLTDSYPSLSASRPFAFVTRITSVVGNTVNFATPLPLAFTAGLTPQAYPQSGNALLSQFGVEDMTFLNSYDPIMYYSSDRCWFKNLEFNSCPGCDRGHIVLLNSVQPEIRRCYVHDVDDWPATTQGMGFGPVYGTCNGLFVDNISYRTSSQFCIEGTTANAFINNYAIDCTRGGTPVVMPQFYYHGPHPAMNLFEGNIGPQECPDGYHGSASHSVHFRNHYNGLCTGRTNDRWIMNLGRGSYYFSLIGNILGDASWNPTYFENPPGSPGHTEWTIYRLGFPNSGSGSMTPETVWSTYPGTYPDASVDSTLIRHGNYDYYNDSQYEWADADHDIPDSLFYDSKPDFFGALTWPPIDPATPTAGDIPAKARWDAYVISSDLDDLFTSNTYWVSPTGAATWANARSETALAGTACCSLATACTNAVAGDTIYLRAGTYTRYIAPSNSGTENNPITFVAYTGETPTFTVGESGGRWAIRLQGNDYIVVDGITSYNCGAFFRIGYGSCYNEIKNCTFTDDLHTEYSTALITHTTSAGTVGTGSDHNWIHDCTFGRYGHITSCNDTGTIRISSNYDDPTANNTFENCVFYNGGHDLMDVGGMYNVVRNNVFHNEESFFADTDGTCPNSPTSGYFGNRCLLLSNSGDRVGTAYHTLVEANRIGHSGCPPDDDGSFGIENSGCHTIIRGNYIYNTAGNGIYFKAQPAPTGTVTLKSGSWGRVYNNTLYHCGFGDSDIDSTYKNGMQFWHYYVPSYWPWPVDVQVKNNIVYDHAGQAFYETGGADIYYANNFTADPGFVNADISDPTSLVLPDLSLGSGSNCIGAGTYLTTAVGGGASSTTLVVADAMYFQDGTWGSSLSDIQADWIAVGTVTNTVQISSINYTTNTITLASAISWSNGDGVWLYKNSSGTTVLLGANVDIGAHESYDESYGFAKTKQAYLVISDNETAKLFTDHPRCRVKKGTNAVWGVYIEPYGSFNLTTTLGLTGLPAGATSSFGSATIGATGSTTLTIGTTSATAGIYSMNITGTATGGDVATTRVILEIVDSDDCAPKVPVKWIRAKKGADAVFTIEAAPTAGYTGDMDLSVSGVPSGATSAFASSNIAYNESTTLTIDTGTATAGTYTLDITGEGPA